MPKKNPKKILKWFFLKKNVKKGSKEVPQVYLQKRKSYQKKEKRKKVTKKLIKGAFKKKTIAEKKKFQILFHPLLSALVSSFMISSLDM
jgi:hypothetical protein